MKNNDETKTKNPSDCFPVLIELGSPKKGDLIPFGIQKEIYRGVTISIVSGSTKGIVKNKHPDKISVRIDDIIVDEVASLNYGEKIKILDKTFIVLKPMQSFFNMDQSIDRRKRISNSPENSLFPAKAVNPKEKRHLRLV